MATQRQSVRDLRRINRSNVLHMIYFNNPITRLKVSEDAGISPATVTNVTTELLSDGIIMELGYEESRGGRPRTILTINPHYGYFIGIDVGETHIHAELFDLTLRRINHTRYLLEADENQPEQVIAHIVQAIKSLIIFSGIADGKVIGVGIGFPGIIDPREGVAISAPNWGWHHIPLLKMLQQHFKFPIHLNNGAQAMALAEMWFGAGKGIDNLAVLLIGTGLGAGIIAQNSLYRGATNSAGEWGHTCIQLGGRACRCGSSGCIEAYVGAHGIIAQLNEIAPVSDLLCDDQMATINMIRDAAQHGDPIAQKVLDQTARYLGAGISNLINLFNPELIVLGGWSGLLLGEQLLPSIYQMVERYALRQPFKNVQISISKLEQDAISLGAACLALEDFLHCYRQ